MGNRAAVAQPCHPLAVEQMSIDTGDLGVMSARTPMVRPESWSTSFSVLRLEILACAGQQRLEIFE
jgi:hypothetical protein